MRKHTNKRAQEREKTTSGAERTCIGQIRVHPAGYGFVVREDGEDDVFISARNRGPALDSDRVKLTTWMGYKGTEGRVLEVIARGRARLSGRLERDADGRGWTLLPDDPRLLAQQDRIQLPEGSLRGHEGQAVLAEITRYPSHPGEPISARVLRVLGEAGRPSIEISKILLCADIPDEFPPEVRQAGARAPAEVRPEDLVDRVDLRDRPFVTIDPENARDFDDAVCVEDGPLPGLERLWVAVADVAHYVHASSTLDLEAQVRGNSIYLPGRSIPMLPLDLSAGICSLNPEVDRLAMVVGLDLDRGGKVVGEHLSAAVIHSRARLDYGGVAAALGAAGDLRGRHTRYRQHLPQLQRLASVAGRLRVERLRRGALDFELPEARVILDEEDPERVLDVVRSRSRPEVRDAYRMIEDCMIAANEAVARFFARRELPTVYRVHDVPDEERLQAFAALALGHGLSFDPEAARSPLYLRGFLEKLRGRPMEQALSYLLLRALKKAHYDVENLGHFGLASSHYLHFTSPIRRYPDLLVHRLLKQRLRREGLPAGGDGALGPAASREELLQQAQACSMAERRAMEVEREVVDLYRACLMSDQIGQEYAGTIVGITASGLFVALEAPYVEGLLKTERLGEGYAFDAQTLRLSGGGGTFSLGDTVRVRVVNVSLTHRKIDFELVGAAAGMSKGKGKRARGSQRGHD